MALLIRSITRRLYKAGSPNGLINFSTISITFPSVSATKTTSLNVLHTRHFHSSPQRASKMGNADAYLAAVKARRTYYQLEHSSPVPDERIQEIVTQAILHTPSSFNSQSTRVLILVGDDHTKLWKDIVKPAVKAVAPADQWEKSEQRLSGFQNAYGSVCQ
jgi:hypothetical protein